MSKHVKLMTLKSKDQIRTSLDVGDFSQRPFVMLGVSDDYEGRAAMITLNDNEIDELIETLVELRGRMN